MFILFICFLLGGNQRELARAKAQKKAAEASKGSKDKTPAQQKRERYFYILCIFFLHHFFPKPFRDADIMRKKQEAAAAKKAAGG